jgi:hypothetical protein
MTSLQKAHYSVLEGVLGSFNLTSILKVELKGDVESDKYNYIGKFYITKLRPDKVLLFTGNYVDTYSFITSFGLGYTTALQMN